MLLDTKFWSLQYIKHVFKRFYNCFPNYSQLNIKPLLLFQFFKKIFNDSIYLIVCNQYSITTQPNPQGILNRTNLSLIYMYPSILPQKFQHFWLKVFETFLTDFSFFFYLFIRQPPSPLQKKFVRIIRNVNVPRPKKFFIMLFNNDYKILPMA